MSPEQNYTYQNQPSPATEPFHLLRTLPLFQNHQHFDGNNNRHFLDDSVLPGNIGYPTSPKLTP